MYVKSKRFKADTRLRTKIRIRRRVTGVEEKPRISVFRSSKHTYGQAISDLDGRTLASASTHDEEVVAALKEIAADEAAGKQSRSTKSVAAATAVGMVLGKKILKQKISQAVFDRNGFVYHGRVAALADGVRKAGVKV